MERICSAPRPPSRVAGMVSTRCRASTSVGRRARPRVTRLPGRSRRKLVPHERESRRAPPQNSAAQPSRKSSRGHRVRRDSPRATRTMWGLYGPPHDGGDRGPRWVNGYASSMRLPRAPVRTVPHLSHLPIRAPLPQRGSSLARSPARPRPRDHLPTRPSPRRTSSPGIPSSPGPSPPRATTDPRRRPSTMRADSSCGTATATASRGWRGWRRRRRTPGRRRGLGRGQFRRDRGISLRARRGVARAFRQDGGDAPRARARASSRLAAESVRRFPPPPPPRRRSPPSSPPDARRNAAKARHHRHHRYPIPCDCTARRAPR